MKVHFVLIGLLLLPLVACEKTANAAPPANAIGRFVPIPGVDVGEVALDTQTGQACRTVDWKNAPGFPNMYASAPLCMSLYENH